MRTTTTFPTRRSCLLLLLLLLLLLPAASAHGNATDDRIVNDCGHSPTGALTGTYTPEQLRHALRNLPGDTSGYSGCHDAIHQALFGDGTGRRDRSDGGRPGASGTAGDGGAGGTTGASTTGTTGGTTTPSTALDTQRAPAGADQPVRVAGATVAPGVLPERAHLTRGLPTALTVLLSLLGLAALVTTVMTIGRRIAAGRSA